MPTGKITTVVPKLVNGQQESYNGKDANASKVYYVSLATIEGVGTCEFSAMTPEPKWKAGMTVVYEDKGKTRDGIPRISIKSEVTPTGQPVKGSYNDPVNAKRMALGMAHTNAMLTVLNLESIGREVPYEDMKGLETIAHKYYEWITENQTITDRDILSRRWYAVEYGAKAILLKKIKVPETGVTNWVLAIADDYMKDVMKIQGPAEI